MDAATINETIKACIHCGICLPACPTYQVTGNEGHSPRGRLYLINDLLTNETGAREDVVEYLDGCLECSACETVCPSGVDYVNILEYARHELGLSNYTKGFMAAVRRLVFQYLLPNRVLLNLARVMGRFLPLRLFNKLAPGFDFEYKKIKTDYIYKSQSRTSRTVSMPLGCVMDTIYNDVHWDSIQVLNAFGYDVYIPETQCCGALAYHSGENKLGEKQLEETTSILAKHQYPVVMNSAGCGAFIKNHSDLESMDLIEALKQAPSLRGADAARQSNAGDWIATHSLSARNDEIIYAVYHPACHLNHKQGVSQDYVELLKRIPSLELIPLHEADLCCGSAGFYNLIQSKLAGEIGKRKAENITSSLRALAKQSNARSKGAAIKFSVLDCFANARNDVIVLTANPGCMSQIQAHLGDEYQVMHPISLIKQYLN
ncbi:MAG: (Fe-S)-binding protein [Candidatus Melainabacteria bacterium]|jgi:glycolate oxidase iron-sulfur subunit|nr:(Fe-S)-binding protein [Candidatus Melainabacteria bacterium]